MTSSFFQGTNQSTYAPWRPKISYFAAYLNFYLQSNRILQFCRVRLLEYFREAFYWIKNLYANVERSTLLGRKNASLVDEDVENVAILVRIFDERNVDTSWKFEVYFLQHFLQLFSFVINAFELFRGNEQIAKESQSGLKRKGFLLLNSLEYGCIFGKRDVFSGDLEISKAGSVLIAIHFDNVGDIGLGGDSLNLLANEMLDTMQHLALIGLVHFLDKPGLEIGNLPKLLDLVLLDDLLQRVDVEEDVMREVEAEFGSLLYGLGQVVLFQLVVENQVVTKLRDLP